MLFSGKFMPRVSLFAASLHFATFIKCSIYYVCDKSEVMQIYAYYACVVAIYSVLELRGK